MRLSKFTVYQQPYLSTYLLNLPCAQFQLNLSFQTIINHGNNRESRESNKYNLKKKTKRKRRYALLRSFQLIRVRPVIRYSPFEQRWIPIENIVNIICNATARFNSLSKERRAGIYILQRSSFKRTPPFSNLATPTFSRIRISRSKRGGRTDSVSRKPYGITDGWRCLESRAELGWKRYGGGNHRKRDRNLWRDGEEGCGGRKSRPGWDGIWIIESGRSRGRTLNKITWEKRWNKVKEGRGGGGRRERKRWVALARSNCEPSFQIQQFLLLNDTTYFFSIQEICSS